MPPDPDRMAAALRAAGCTTPALVIDLAQVERNIAAMLAHVGDPARWRPHVKTIKQARIVSLLIDAGVRHFKCATVPELRMVLDTGARHGVALDVLLAYPIGATRLPEVAAIARRAEKSRVGVTADDPEHLAVIAATGGLDVWIDVDIGMHRTGSSLALWRQWAAEPDRSPVVGVQAYEGHVRWNEATAGIYDGLAALARDLEGCRWLLTSGSLTFDPAMHAIVPDAGDHWVHQIGAGTLVLCDVASTAAASTIGATISTFVATRVVARPGPGRVTLDAGSKAIAPDRPAPNCTVLGHPKWRPLVASEEHLPVDIGDEHAPPRDTLLLLVPDHVCTTVNLYREVVYLRDGVPCGSGPIDASGREPQAMESPR